MGGVNLGLTNLTFSRTTPDTWTAGDFVIKRWKGYRYGYTSEMFCYVVQHNGDSLTNLIKWSQPHDLAEAKRQAQQYHDLLKVRAYNAGGANHG